MVMGQGIRRHYGAGIHQKRLNTVFNYLQPQPNPKTPLPLQSCTGPPSVDVISPLMQSRPLINKDMT